MKIWLDDVRPAPEGWVWIKDAKTIISMLNVHSQQCSMGIAGLNITEISLDHDLGDETANTGYDVVKHIEMLVRTENYPAPKMHIHSANPVGRKNMMAGIEAITRFGQNRD